MKKKYIAVCIEDKDNCQVKGRLFRLESSQLKDVGVGNILFRFNAPDGLTIELKEKIKQTLLEKAKLECSGRWSRYEPEIVQVVRFGSV